MSQVECRRLLNFALLAMSLGVAQSRAGTTQEAPLDDGGVRVLDVQMRAAGGSEDLIDADVTCDWKYGDENPVSAVERAQSRDDVVICSGWSYPLDYTVSWSAEGLVQFEEDILDSDPDVVTYVKGDYELVWQAFPELYAQQSECSVSVSVPTGTEYTYSSFFPMVPASKGSLWSQWVQITYHYYHKEHGYISRSNCAYLYFGQLSYEPIDHWRQ